MPSPRRLVYMDVSKLTPAPRNPKLHDIDGIRASMTELGYIEPVILDERTGKLISGHGRVETLTAAREAGLEPPDGIIVTPRGVWQVPVVRGWGSLDDASAETALVALNRYVERGGWDNEALTTILADLDVEHRAVAGYPEDEYAALIGLDAPTASVPSGDQRDEIRHSYGVIIECEDEQAQAELLDRFLEEGLTCRALM